MIYWVPCKPVPLLSWAPMRPQASAQKKKWQQAHNSWPEPANGGASVSPPSIRTPPQQRLGSILSRQETTSSMVGLMHGLWSTHLQAISRTFSICSSYPMPRRCGSRTSICFPSDFISCTHFTSSFDNDKPVTGRLPVSSSSRTTPKLYISPLNVATHPCPYSGGM